MQSLSPLLACALFVHSLASHPSISPYSHPLSTLCSFSISPPHQFCPPHLVSLSFLLILPCSFSTSLTPDPDQNSHWHRKPLASYLHLQKSPQAQVHLRFISALSQMVNDQRYNDAWEVSLVRMLVYSLPLMVNCSFSPAHSLLLLCSLTLLLLIAC